MKFQNSLEVGSEEENPLIRWTSGIVEIPFHNLENKEGAFH